MIKRAFLLISLLLLTTSALACKDKKVSIYVNNNTPFSVAFNTDDLDTAKTSISYHEVPAHAQSQKIGDATIRGQAVMAIDALLLASVTSEYSLITYSTDAKETKLNIQKSTLLIDNHTYHINAADTVNDNGNISFIITISE